MEKKRWIVLGLGVSGRSAIRFLLNRGHEAVGVDDRLSIDEELNSFAGKGVLLRNSCPQSYLERAEAVVKSPGISNEHPLVLEAKAIGLPIVCDIELVAKTLCGVPCIGVTGTNGKTTVTLLIEHILNRSGLSFKACGNIGLPIADALMTPSCQGLIVELSSYQLETLSTPFLDAALLLNITPDHLDRYPSFEEYQKAKLRIFSLLKEKGAAFAHVSVPLTEILTEEVNMARYGFSPGILSGCSPHDADNIEAAFLACKYFGLSEDQMKDTLFTFKKPLHRIEFICDIRGVSFYNDSKGTNIDAVKKAVDTMNGEVILIAGGVDKGASYTSWKESFSNKVKMICAIGQAAPKIKRELDEAIEVQIFEGLYQATAYAAANSKPGGNVLLSPGCASFDMFRDYRHRGDEFKRIVKLLTIGENKEDESS